MVDFRLDGHQVLVTGAGRGLGAAIVGGLAALGAVVHGTSRSPRPRRSSPPTDALPHVLDVANVDAVNAFVEELQTTHGVDMLVNNAGVNITAAAIDVTEDDWTTVFDTNLRGSFFLSTAMARTWLDRGTPGAIVNVASQAGTVAIGERVSYGSSKAGLST